MTGLGQTEKNSVRAYFSDLPLEADIDGFSSAMEQNVNAFHGRHRAPLGRAGCKGKTLSSRDTWIVALGSRLSKVRSSLNSGRPATAPACPFRAISRLMHRSKYFLFDHLVGIDALIEESSQ
jgi:hypothetical protein